MKKSTQARAQDRGGRVSQGYVNKVSLTEQLKQQKLSLTFWSLGVQEPGVGGVGSC